jgi:hypothetical protein
VAFISDVLGIVGMLLQLAALLLLARGPLSRYFPLFLYLLTWAVATAAEGWILRTAGVRSTAYYWMYFGSELLLDSLLFVLVISLTMRVLEGNPLRSAIMKLCLGICAVVVAIPFVLFESRIFAESWNQKTAQLLNFGAALMLLALWSAMLITRVRDRQLLLVTAGLGLTLTAAALTLGVRQFTHQGGVLRNLIDLFHRLTQIASPAIWCWAFWPTKARPPKATAAAPRTA